MLTSLKRVINSGWKGFSRNMGLSLATVFIMIMVILMITFLLLLNPVSENLIADVKQKVDISVYFKEDAIEENIMQVKMEISRMPEINEVEYISKEEALENFLNRHKEDTVLVESLTEVGYNPFLASLNIRAQEAFQYEQISGFLENSSFKELVNKIDYNERKSVIEKVYAFTAGVKNGGIVFSIFLAIIALVIAYNTIRIAIQNSKEELAVMRLVGASNWFVRGPFLAQGVIIGFISAIIAFIITFAFSYGINAKTGTIMSTINIMDIFSANALRLLLAQIATGIVFGMGSSLIAVRKYLKI